MQPDRRRWPRVLRRVVAEILGVVALSVLLVFTMTPLAQWAWPERALQADAIVVLSGGLDRIDTGARLYRSGAAPLLVLTGLQGAPLPDGRDPMTAQALDLGVPASAILREGAARSTLQNAVFTRRALGGDWPQSVILVTDSYHLPRAWASFRWAGARDIALVASRGYPDRPLGYRYRTMTREVAAWWFNLLRLPVHEAAALLRGEQGLDEFLQ